MNYRKVQAISGTDRACVPVRQLSIGQTVAKGVTPCNTHVDRIDLQCHSIANFKAGTVHSIKGVTEVIRDSRIRRLLRSP